jgi:hypothetical protein
MTTMELTGNNQDIPGLTELRSTTYSTADAEKAVFYGSDYEWPSQEEAPTFIVVAGDVYAIDTETIPAGTPIAPDSGITRLGDEDSESDAAPHA